MNLSSTFGDELHTRSSAESKVQKHSATNMSQKRELLRAFSGTAESAATVAVMVVCGEAFVDAALGSGRGSAIVGVSQPGWPSIAIRISRQVSDGCESLSATRWKQDKLS
jgi:hypothetical protein